MNLLLFETHEGESYPILEKASRPTKGVATGSGTWDRVKQGVQQAYQRLMDKLDYHERLCSQLRHATDLQVYHPASIDSAEAQERLLAFLKARYIKHSRWFRIDAFFSIVGGIVGLPLIPLPGPNILFFYPAARTLGHHLARVGARHALHCDNLVFRSEPLIDQVQTHLQDLETVPDLLEELVERYQLQSLETLLILLGKI